MTEPEMPETEIATEMPTIEPEATAAPPPAEPAAAAGPEVRPPSRRLSLQVEGRAYLDYLMLSERILFPGRLTAKQKDERILQLALALLRAAVEQQEAMFMPAEQLKR